MIIRNKYRSTCGMDCSVSSRCVFVGLLPRQEGSPAAGAHQWRLINPSPWRACLVGVEMCGLEGVIRSYGVAFCLTICPLAWLTEVLRLCGTLLALCSSYAVITALLLLAFFNPQIDQSIDFQVRESKLTTSNVLSDPQC